MKKLALLMMLVLLIGIFAACAKVPEDIPAAFYVTNTMGTKAVCLGDARDAVAKLIGPDEGTVAEFEEDGVERVSYWNTDGVAVDYKDNVVCAIRISENGWKTGDGIAVGVTLEEAKKHYPADKIYVYEQEKSGGFWVSHDAQGNVIDFDENSDFMIHITGEDGAVKQVTVQDNRI